MARMGRLIVEALVLEYGRDEVLRRLAHPFWFQSFGALMGMDWHSSGITTSVVAALRRGLAPVADELGLFVCGGRGRASRRTPVELTAVAERVGLDAEALTRSSRLVAKVDNCAVQDGFQLYLHSFIVTADGRWTVVQQGMCPHRKQARRYHWASEGLESFVEAPHRAIEGTPGGEIVNLVDVRASAAREQTLALAAAGAERLARESREARSLALASSGDQRASQTRGFAGGSLPADPGRAESSSGGEGGPPVQPFLQMPLHHEVRAENVVERRLQGTLSAVEAASPATFDALLLTPGLGPRTLATLAFVAEVIHGTPSRFSDPARFSLALGGKDGHPFPVPLRVYDETLRVLKKAIKNARLGRSEAMGALAHLDREARRLEGAAKADPHLVDDYIERERAASWAYAGRTVSGWARSSGRPQLELFAGRVGEDRSPQVQPARPEGPSHRRRGPWA